MKNFFLKFTFLTLALFCFSCTQKPAKIVNRSGNFYGKNNSYNKNKYSATKFAEDIAASNQVEIIDGDTLYNISKKYQIPLRDLIQENNLKPPYILKSGTSLKIPEPSYHIVKKGDTIYNISRTYNMNVDNLVELNDLKSPYTLYEGQKIRTAKMQQNVAKTEVVNKNLDADIVEKPLNEMPKNTDNLGDKTAEIPKKIAIPNISEVNLNKQNQFSWPLRGEVVSKFGPKKGGLYNDGINIKAASGTKVAAAEDGVVAYVGNELKGYGNLVIVKHSGGWITAYAHLSKATAKRGQKVKKLEIIGEVGSTGNVDSPQLYFGLRKGRDAVNPENYL